MSFKDFFSEKSSEYKKYRPDYPKALFKFLASLPGSRQLAWDCGTGSGQCAHGLSPFFTKIIATDGSKNQIQNAKQHPAIEYRVMLAESTDFPPDFFDLITVGQALHWFNVESFFTEAKRVLKRDGVLAVWSYNLLKVSDEIDPLIRDFYDNELEPYWPPERRHVEADYSTIQFPFHNQQSNLFKMRGNWSLEQLVGYISSWSAVKLHLTRNGHDAVNTFSDKLASKWGNGQHKKQLLGH